MKIKHQLKVQIESAIPNISPDPSALSSELNQD